LLLGAVQWICSYLTSQSKGLQVDLQHIRQRNFLSWAAVAILAALCAVLAVMQYRWIGEVAEAERQRLRDDLQSRLDLLRRDLDGQVAAACYRYLPTAAEVKLLGRDEAYLARYRRQKHDGDEIVERMAVAVPQKLDLALYVPDDLGQHLTNISWPPAWLSMQQHLLTRLRHGPAAPDFLSSLVEFPRFGSDESHGDRGVREQEWLLIDLDDRYLANSILPQMLTRYLGESGRGEYEAEVVSQTNSFSVIYRSPNNFNASPWPADATVGLLEISPIPIFQSETGKSPKTDSSDKSPVPAPVASTPPPGVGPFHGLWLLRVRHKAGSLEAIVARARRRNLLLSSGLLLLILATIALLLRFARRAQHFAELQVNFVAGVSHELRTPLSVIRTAAYNLRGDLAAQPAQVVRYGALIQNEAQKLSALVEQVLRYANTRAGRVVQRREPVKVAELIELSLQAAQAAAPAKIVHVEKHLAPNLPPILADKESLQHALQNLFDNALKYGTLSENWLGITAAAITNGGPPSVEIRIADRGMGIPKSERHEIFKPFFRGQRALHDQIHGTGLGLNLVKKIVEAHGGTVTMQNREGPGAEFIVTIPSLPKEPADEITPPSD
jgi:signal transduction histidine kinase